jgi:LemA protein
MSSTVVTWIVIGAIVLLVLWIIMIYNGLVAMRQRVNQAYADIDVQMKQRHDLIPNLVETVKGYASHERGTLEAVVQARNAAITAGAGGVAAQAAAENVLSGALRQLFALSEAYPDLKANQNFQQLQSELSDIENKLAAARRFFNNAVQEYNTGIQQFPAVLLAGSFGFAPKEFFDVGVEERKVIGQAPQVKFGWIPACPGRSDGEAGARAGTQRKRDGRRPSHYGAARFLRWVPGRVPLA